MIEISRDDQRMRYSTLGGGLTDSVVEPEPPFLAGAGAVKKGRLRLNLSRSSSNYDPC